jgi:hypothetical protein
MPDRLTQVVSGEPSLGMSHEHYYLIYSGATLTVAGSPYTIDLSAQVPSGAKRAFIWFNGYGSVADAGISFYNYAQTKIFGLAAANPLGYRNIECYVSLDSSARFKIVVTTATWNYVTMAMSYYAI